MRKGVWACLAIVLLCGSAAAQSRDGMTWYAILGEGGRQLGHASYEVVQRDGGREVIESQEVYLREQGGAPMRTRMRTITTEDAAGAATSIVETQRTGRFSARSEVRIAGGSAHLTRETPSGVASYDVALPVGVRFDGGELLLRDWDAGATPTLRFDSFNLDAMAVERVVIEALAPRDASGRIQAVRRRYEGGELRGVARLVIGADGRIIESVQPMFGAAFHITETTREAATRRHPPYPILPSSFLRSPSRIPASARSGHLRYRLAFRENLTFALPQTGEQRADMRADAIILDICDSCGPGLPTDAAYLADALQTTPWLQSDHARLREIADHSDREKSLAMMRAHAQQHHIHGNYARAYQFRNRRHMHRDDIEHAASRQPAVGPRAVQTGEREAVGCARGWAEKDDGILGLDRDPADDAAPCRDGAEVDVGGVAALGEGGE